jgi:hypothetical protein
VRGDFARRLQRCSLAYECERKRNGESTPWPLIALAMLAAMAVLSATV